MSSPVHIAAYSLDVSTVLRGIVALPVDVRYVQATVLKAMNQGGGEPLRKWIRSGGIIRTKKPPNPL